MRLTLRLLGLDVVDLTIETDTAYDEPGESTTYPVGFTATHELPDQVGLLVHPGWDE